jgi:hypothetical protein
MFESSRPQCATTVAINKELPRAYIPKNNKIIAFDFFGLCFPRELLSYCS